MMRLLLRRMSPEVTRNGHDDPFCFEVALCANIIKRRHALAVCPHRTPSMQEAHGIEAAGRRQGLHDLAVIHGDQSNKRTRRGRWQPHQRVAPIVA